MCTAQCMLALAVPIPSFVCQDVLPYSYPAACNQCTVGSVGLPPVLARRFRCAAASAGLGCDCAQPSFQHETAEQILKCNIRLLLYVLCRKHLCEKQWPFVRWVHRSAHCPPPGALESSGRGHGGVFFAYRDHDSIAGPS